jgi:hypothetical protein
MSFQESAQSIFILCLLSACPRSDSAQPKYQPLKENNTQIGRKINEEKQHNTVLWEKDIP